MSGPLSPRRPSMSSRVTLMIARSLLRPLAERTRVHGTALSVLRALVRLVAWASTPSTSSVTIEAVTDDRPVRGEWIRPKAGIGDAVVLYVHGGGFVLSSPTTHRAVTAPLACATAAPVFSVGYRRAPEHRFPAAIDDVRAAYDWLLAAGVTADRIVLAGDSVGGHMIATMLCDIAETGAVMPAGAVLFSPWLSLDALDADATQVRRDPFLSPRFARRCVAAYVGEVAPDDPRVAPLLVPAKLLRRFPPVSMVFGDTEYMRGQGHLLHQRLVDVGVASELHIVPGQIHDFVLFARWLPEGAAALRDAARFIIKSVADGDSRDEPVAGSIRSRPYHYGSP